MADAATDRTTPPAAGPGGPPGDDPLPDHPDRPDPLWDDWDVPPRRSGLPELHCDGFDGPLDLLLDLAERQRIDLSRIPVAELAAQCAAALQRLAGTVPIDRRMEWLILASRLLLLRSRLLGPASRQAHPAAAHAARQAVERLETRRFLGAAADWLQARPQLGHDVFARPPHGPRHGPDRQTASYMDLMTACLTLLRDANPDPTGAALPYAPMREELFRMPQALARLRARLAGLTGPAAFESFLPPLPEPVANRDRLARSAVATTLLAALELTRTGEAVITQPNSFGPIQLGTALPETGNAT